MSSTSFAPPGQVAVGDPEQAVTDLSPSLHNFVVVVAVLLLVLWWVKAALRARSLYELKAALEARNVVRIDGLSSSIRDVGAVSRAHLQQILTARSRYHQSLVKEVRAACHLNPDTLALAPPAADGPAAPTLAFGLASDREAVVELWYGLPHAAVAKLHELQHAAGSAATSKVSRRSRKAAKRVASAGGVEMAALGRSSSVQQRARFELATSEALGRWSGDALPACPAGAPFEVPLDAELLHAASRAAPAGQPGRYVLAILARAADTHEAPPRGETSRASAAGEQTQKGQEEEKKEAADPAAASGAADTDADAAGRGPRAMQLTLVSVGGPGPVAEDEKLPEDFVPSLKVETQLVLSDEQVLELHGLYGIEDPEHVDCTVCLVEPKDIVPLPCRHCCLCHECFEHVQGKCPVCRAQILSYMRFTPGASDGALAAAASDESEAAAKSGDDSVAPLVPAHGDAAEAGGADGDANSDGDGDAGGQ